MPDEPFYLPNLKPTATPRYRPATGPLWGRRKDHITWSCELRFHGESYGWESMILRNGELHISRRFALNAVAIQWAEFEKADIEKGRS